MMTIEVEQKENLSPVEIYKNSQCQPPFNSYNPKTPSPVAGIYESNHPKYNGFIIRNEDLVFCYVGGFGDWIVYAQPLNELGDVVNEYKKNNYSSRFEMNRHLGKLIQAI